MAFAAFELVKHQGWVVPLAALGALLPLAGGRSPRLRSVLQHPVPPLLVLVAFTVLLETNTQAAPGFTAGLAWLAHVAVRRGLTGARGGGREASGA
jgi:hypothetical protein